jgi:hypothetical protein
MSWRLGALVCALGLVPACATDGDAKSRELVAISHLTAPAGSLSVSDDRSYAFLDDTTKSEKRGTLSSAEFEALQPHVARASLDALYAQRDSDPDRCGRASDGYILVSPAGTGCFVLSTVADAGARASVEFFATLFSQKANEPAARK